MALYIQEHLDHRGFSSFPQSLFEDICGWNSVGVAKNSDILGSTGFTARVKKKGQKKALPWVFFNSMICHKGSLPSCDDDANKKDKTDCCSVKCLFSLCGQQW